MVKYKRARTTLTRRKKRGTRYMPQSFGNIKALMKRTYLFAQMAYPVASNWTIAGDAQAPFVPQNNTCIRLQSTVTTSSTPAAGFSIFGTYFTLNDMADVSAYTALFDQYQIKELQVEMICSGSESVNWNATITHGLAPFYFQSVIDYDDANVATWTPSYLDQFSTSQDHIYGATVGKKYKRIIKPGTSSLVYKTSGSTIGYEQTSKNTWIDCNTSDVQHYGLKICVPNAGNSGNTSTPPAIDVRVRYIVAFRNVR